MPDGVERFNQDIQGTEEFVVPATQHDALVWPSGSAYDLIFDMAGSVIHDLSGFGLLAEETSSWPYRHDRDLTSIDGWENPTLLDAPESPAFTNCAHCLRHVSCRRHQI